MVRYLAFLVIFITWLVCFSESYPWNGFPTDKAEWGTFDDFAGGVTNPILTFSTMVMLIKSIDLQKEANDSIIKQSLRMHEVSEGQKETDDLRSFESSFYSLAEAPRRGLGALKTAGKSRKVYSAANAVVYLEGYLLNVCRSRTSKELTEQFSKSDTDSSTVIFSIIRSFYILSKFTNESCPDNHRERYYEIVNYIMPAKFLHLVCLAYVLENWEITSDFERHGFFKRKGLDEYVFNFTCVKDYYWFIQFKITFFHSLPRSS